MGHFYASSQSELDKVAVALQRQADRGRAAGLDSEFYNVKIQTQSCVARSKLHLWSVAINRWPLKLHPRGYYEADAAVLGVEALDHKGLRDWLESEAPKAVHNLPVDAHTFGNHGIKLGGVINTLARARFCYPERARGFPEPPGFGLDDLGADILGLGKTEDGWVSEDWWRKHGRPLDPAIFVRITEEEVVKRVKAEVCSCGEKKCRKRKGHDRPVTEVRELVRKWGGVIPLEEVVPGHERWERACAYAARDSLVALYLLDRMDRMMDGKIPFPWVKHAA
jgi:hypothetical protein